MPTIEQIRAARALLDWSQSDLADHSSLSQTGIARIENGTNQPNSGTLAKIIAAFEGADIEFLGSTGVRKKVGEIKVFKGTEGFRAFMDDVYNVAKEKGGEICLFNAKPSNWYKWLGEDWYKSHSERMQAIKDRIDFKVTVKEGEDLLIGSSFVEYRWFPKNLFNEQSFYAYGNKLAFMNFEENSVQIMVLENKEFCDGFRVLFNVAWDHISFKPAKND